MKHENPRCVTLLMVGLASVAACKKSAAEQKDETEEQSVIVSAIGKEDVAEVLSYVADLRPYAEVKIYSPVPDRILYFPWKDGQEVKRGETIALIRKETLDKGLEQMVAQMESLDAQIHNLESELARSKDLLAAGVITRQVFDQVQTSYLSTKAQRKALEAGRGQLAVTANNAVITAPIAGVIAGKNLETGDLAVPQTPMCQVYDLTKMKASLRLIEADVAKVRLGQQVSLKLDAYPGRLFAGSVTAIMPFLDPATRTNTIEVVIDNPAEPTTGMRALKAGMYGAAEIVVALRKDRVVAPEPSLLLDSNLLAKQRTGETLRKAFVVDAQGVAHVREVTLAARKGSLFEVKTGLNEGDKVVVRGQHGLKDGQKVRVVAAD
ncbi:MAG: efflux RND transporter periplasmic adaptor subunit [Deltaproteobacteria bacterium]|nr:efflux RND transporter periplasmic adaptor subunit [Deltaproteobacteria bacterium]